MSNKRKHNLSERIVINDVHPGLLRIDREGRVWRSKKGGGWVRAESLARSYYQVRVQHDGVRYYVTAARLVWQYFNGDIVDGLCINHINGIKLDNRPENLELVTYSENIKHAFRTGLKDQYGQKNPNCKLSNEDIADIRKKYASGKYSGTVLSEIYGVAQGTISKIVRGKRRLREGGKLSMNNQHRKASTFYLHKWKVTE